MKFTDIFIRRPVLACVISLMILVLGLRAFGTLPVLEYPKTENGVITITTTYYGADAATVAGFITTPLENAVAQANGIDYMTSTSVTGTSTIILNLRLNYDANAAMTEVLAKVNSVMNQLPNGTQQPVITVKVGQTLDALIIGFSSDEIGQNQITDYLTRNVQPVLQAVPGVQTAEFLGAKNFALRAWLDPAKLAAYNLTATNVYTALSNNDYVAGLGQTKGQMIQINLTASTTLHTAAQFRNMIISQVDGGIVRLGDVAHVTLGADDYTSSASFDGKTGVYIGIQTTPDANLLAVISAVKARLPGIEAQLPKGLNASVIYDSTAFVNSSIHDVATTLIEALVIVTLVVFAFLGSPRSVIIPVVAIPLSLVGTFAMMQAFGFTINLLTLLALVLAIGLVVDDAIIVVENVNRHLAEGKRPRDAAMQAARELGGPIIAMTAVLVAVYVPIGFQGGLTGALFTEFAFTLVGAVTVSAIIALTLSPMMSSLMLRPHQVGGKGLESRLVDGIDRMFGWLHRSYERRLRGSLATIPVTMVFIVIVFVAVGYLYSTAASELAPQEDQGVVILQPTPAADATLQQNLMWGKQTEAMLTAIPEAAHTFQVFSPSQNIGGVTLTPWDQRHRTATTIQRQLQQEFGAVAGQRIVAFQPPALPGASGLPIQFVLESNQPPVQFYEQTQRFLHTAQKSGLFLFLDSDLKYDMPQETVQIDRDKVSELGLNVNTIGTALSNMIGGGYVNYFDLSSRSYKVIPQVAQTSRLNPQQLLNYPVAAVNNIPVPLSAVATLRTETVPESLNHFQQLTAATISGVAIPGVTQDKVLSYLQGLTKSTMPSSVSVDYGGELRQYVQESGGFLITFGFAVIVIFLTLAALFESFRDPLIILISVPMSLAGALLFINLGFGGASLNIYTEVGLVTLMGLISKHGILMVEVANERQQAGLSKREAIVAAAGIRLRPILMTTAAMVLGVVPLITASGAGAASRYNMGLVIATGLAIGTLFTLFVLPAVYLILAGDHSGSRDEPQVEPKAGR